MYWTAGPTKRPEVNIPEEDANVETGDEELPEAQQLAGGGINTTNTEGDGVAVTTIPSTSNVSTTNQSTVELPTTFRPVYDMDEGKV